MGSIVGKEPMISKKVNVSSEVSLAWGKTTTKTLRNTETNLK